MVLKKQGQGWEPVSLKNFGSEVELQQLLAGSPELIPGCAGTATVRELPVPGAGFLDLMCVDETGTLTLVECKLAKNAEIRRAVVGQIFAYASALDGMSYGEFADRFAARAKQSLVEAVRAVSTDDLNEAAFKQALSENLANGTFQLVLAVDEITSELKGIVEYLNRHLAETISLVALELGYLPIGEDELLVPATYGAEIAERARSKQAQRWTEEDLTEAVGNLSPGPARNLVQSLLDHAKANAATLKGGMGAAPAAGFYYSVQHKRPSVWSLYVKETGPVVAVNLGSIRKLSEPLAERVLETLQRSAQLAAPLTGVEDPLGKYPEYPLSQVLEADPGAADVLREALSVATSPIAD